MPKKLTMFSFLLIFTLILAGCSNKKESAVKKEEKLSVYTTIFPLADFAKKIGGNYVNVEAIYPPGADSHTFEPSQKQTVKVAKADLFIYNGAELEPFAEKMEKTLQKENIKIVNASKGIELRAATEDEHHDHGDGHKHKEDEHHHDKDPHVWLNPILAMKQAEKIKNALVELQPDHKQEFEKNFAALQTKFTDLDDRFKAAVANAKTKEILVSHAAYGYWEQRYGLKQISIAGISASDEPSQKKLAEITKTVKEYGLKYILFETFSTPKVASVIQKETGTKILRLNHLATISEDDAKNNKDYFTLMEENVNTLKEATQFASVAEKPSEKQEQTTESHTHENEHDHSHNHSHAHDKATERIYEGYFEDNQVKDRPLSDWTGDWQSVYPYLQDGTLDEVFAYKAKHKGKMSAKEYKEYYNEGYQTDVNRIVIQGDTVTFYKNKEEYSGKYIYDGYKILTYDAGNRGVRYIFKLAEKTEGVPQYIQFSDHGIYPNKADHYHLYWGDNREALLDEVIHWPTYYPSNKNGHDIAHEMMVH